MKPASSFIAITTEGGLLPADFLAELLAPKTAIEGLTPVSYNLAEGERISEQVNRSWNRLKGRWADFKKAIADKQPGDSTTTETRDRWLHPIFQELGFGQKLPAARAVEIDGRNYPVSHGWSHVPIHLVGSHVDIDRRTPGAIGAAKASPHSLVQQVLNASTGHLWGIVSNGLTFRLLRDSVALTRLSYVEWDLAAIFDGDLYSEFFVLWLVAHQSRFDAERAELCWLERWKKSAEDKGLRALENLYPGVKTAIAALGAGLVSHPANTALREKLRSGDLTTQEFYRQVLRVIYRLLFLFVAEDRGLLHPPDESEAALKARRRYLDFYSITRLRALTLYRAGTPHPDLWQVFQFLTGKLGTDTGCPELALPALGSFLWTATLSTPDLRDSLISNRHFLEAVHALAFVRDGNVRRGVDYKNLGSEELGSVYQGLLELHPQVNADAGTFVLETAAGNERKTTGSFYTPDSLVQCLLESALEPLIAERLGKAKIPEEKEAALLSLKVCDPAVGSGHFILRAGHRIAKHLARVRSGEEEPSPAVYRTALRDVIGHCLYGVDMNPMAAELCRMSLWLEALEPGKPLSFLDHHIRVGNSLLGTTPALIAAGLPADAFTAIEGDDKEACRELKQLNAREVGGFGELFAGEDTDTQRRLREAADVVEALPDDTPEHVRQKAAAFAEAQDDDAYRTGRDLANAWCAAFVIRKRLRDPNNLSSGVGLTQRHLNDIANGRGLPDELHEEVARLCLEYGFFHWHLAFPEVFARGGFDCMLGNPPWDTMSPDAKEFFATYEPEVRVQDKTAQTATIDRLLQSPSIAARWDQTRRHIFASVHFIKNSGRYLLFAEGNLGKGDFNIYRMFVELALQTARSGGSAAQLAPEGLYNGANCAAIRKALFSTCELSLLLGFENAREVWFKNVHTALKFCLYVAKPGGETEEFLADFNIRTIERLAVIRGGGGLRVPVAMVEEFSPDALAIMEFGNQRDIDIATKMYSRWPKFGDEFAGPPKRTYMAEIHMGNDREIFGEVTDGLPLYEGRMIDQFDHRAKAYRSGRGRAAIWDELRFGQPDKSIQSQWRIPMEQVPNKVQGRMRRYRPGFCDVTGPTNERSLIAALIPPGFPCGHTVPTIIFEGDFEWAYMPWLAVANSFAMDWLVRQKVQLHMTYTVLDSLPFPRVAKDNLLARKIVPIVLHLTCCGPEMTAYWNARAEEGWVESVPADGPPPGAEDEAERQKLRAELDAIVAHDVFGLTATEMEYILENFPTWKQRDEKRYGEFRTKRLILEAFVELSTPAEVAPPDVRTAPLPQLPATQRPAFKSPDYFQHILPLIARLQPEGVEAGRLLHALEILAESEPRRAALSGHEDGPWKQWAAGFPRGHAFSDAAAAVIVLLGDGTLTRWQGRIQPAPDAHFVDEAWLNTDAFLALRLALDAPAEAVQRRRAETELRFPELAKLLLAA